VFTEGDTYEGRFQEGKFHGKGVFKSISGKTFDQVHDKGDIVTSTLA